MMSRRRYLFALGYQSAFEKEADAGSQSCLFLLKIRKYMLTIIP